MKSKYLHVKSCKYLLYKQLERKVRILFHWISISSSETERFRWWEIRTASRIGNNSNLASSTCQIGKVGYSLANFWIVTLLKFPNHTKAKPPRINPELFFYYKSRWRLNAANRTGFVYIMVFRLGCSPCMSPALVPSTYGCPQYLCSNWVWRIILMTESSQDQIVFVKSNLNVIGCCKETSLPRYISSAMGWNNGRSSTTRSVIYRCAIKRVANSSRL